MVYRYTKEYKKYLIIYIIFIPLLSAISIIAPLFEAKELLYITNSVYKDLFQIALLIFTIEICRNFFIFFSKQSLLKYFRESMKILKMLALRAVLHIKNKNLDEISSGVIIDRVNKDCSKMADIIPTIVDNSIGIITNLGVLVTIFFINKILWIFLISGAIIVYIFNRIRISKFFAFDKKMRVQGEKVTSFISEFIRGIRDIKVLNANESFLNEANNQIETHNSLNYEGILSLRKYDLITGSIKDLLNLIFIFISIIMLKYNTISVAGLLAVYMYKNRIYNMFNFYTSLQEALQDFKLSSQRVFEIIEGDKYERESFGKTKLKKVNGDFEFKHVNFSYKKNIPVLKDVSFKVEANTTVAFVGKSGSGKTTIFGLLSKLYEVNSGSIYIDGIDINELTEDSIRGNMTIINQSPYIFNMSIIDNLKIVNPSITLKEIKKACKMACLDEYINTLPEKYNTIVGEGGITLSGGQRQRLAIARALIQKTEIILFDEATSALDNETQEQIQEAINNMKNEYTILIIAHRFSTVINSDKIIYINNGKIQAEGTHSELLKKSKGYKKLYELELKNK